MTTTMTTALPDERWDIARATDCEAAARNDDVVKHSNSFGVLFQQKEDRPTYEI
jgi:hypothetical protein